MLWTGKMITKSEYLNDEKILRRDIDWGMFFFFCLFLGIFQGKRKKFPQENFHKDYNDLRVLKIYIPKQENSVMLG